MWRLPAIAPSSRCFTGSVSSPLVRTITSFQRAFTWFDACRFYFPRTGPPAFRHKPDFSPSSSGDVRCIPLGTAGPTRTPPSNP